MSKTKKRYLAFDTETGGIYPEQHSLLEVAFVVLDENLKVLDSLVMKLKDKETNATYKVTPGALAINKVNILEHNKESITYEQGKVKLLNFLEKNKEVKFTPLGHNIAFDFGFVYANLMPKEQLDKYVDYHAVDTSVIGNYLKDKGIGPSGRKYSLKHWATFFGMEVDEKDLHSALDDVILTIEVYKRMLELE